MANEALRQLLMRRIDALLGRPLLVSGEDRRLLSAIRGYARDMTEADLNRLDSYMTHYSPGEGDETMTKKKAADDTQAAGDVGHDEDLIVYPDSLPGALWTDLARAFRGELEAKRAAHLFYHCAGYGLGLYDPHDHPTVQGKASAPVMTKEEAAKFCDEQTQKGEAHDPKSLGPAFWAMLALAARLLAEWLEKQ